MPKMFKKVSLLMFIVSSLLLFGFVLIQSCSKNKKETNKEDLSNYEQITEKAKELFAIRKNNPLGKTTRQAITPQEIIKQMNSNEKILLEEIISYSKIALENNGAENEFNKIVQIIQNASDVNKKSLLSTLYMTKGLVIGIKSEALSSRTAPGPFNPGCCVSSSVYYYNYMVSLCLPGGAYHGDPDCTNGVIMQQALDFLDMCMENPDHWCLQPLD